MSFVYALLGVIAGFFVILLLLYLFIRVMLNKYGFSGRSLLSIYDEVRESEAKEKIRHKNVSGMTKLLLPEIRRDFENFNESEFYSLVEKAIYSVLEAIEKRDVTNLLKDNDFDLIVSKLQVQVHDLLDAEIQYCYNDIMFHKHAIRSYQKKDGMIILTISTSLEYYFKEVRKGKIIKNDKIKKQTRYTTEFVYIVDSKKAGFDLNVLGLHCPNCGAAIESLNQHKCKYCKSGLNIQVANLLKCWKIINMKEDY